MKNKLTYPEKRALYESIMKKIAKQVKSMLNESYSNESNKDEYFDIETAITKMKSGKRIFLTNAQGICRYRNGKIYIRFLGNIYAFDDKDALRTPSFTLTQFRKYYGPDNEYGINYQFKEIKDGERLI